MRGKYKTNIEEIMAMILDDIMKVEVVYDYSIRCKYGYRIDFAIPEKKLGIECDGEYWHKKGNSHDRKRDAYLKKQGWTMIRFTGKEIIWNTDYCIWKLHNLFSILEIERRIKER